MIAPGLDWLPKHSDPEGELRALRADRSAPEARLVRLAALAAHRLDFLQAQRLDRLVAPLREVALANGFRTVKLAILASATADHLLACIRVAALRRGLWADCHLAGFGQYRQELLDEGSSLYGFAPDVVVLALDSMHALPALALTEPLPLAERAVAERIEEWRGLWRLVRERLKAVVVHQTILDVADPLFGNLDGLVAASPASLIAALNGGLRAAARADGALVLDLARRAARDGLRAWFDPVRWHQAKQEIAPAAAPAYGELLARTLAAIRGLSRKCLVLDLDNTLWGGVVGDDGIDGIALGPGSALGEAFGAFQGYVKRLSERGVILAVCSKNDPEIAETAFRTHPEMVLKPDDLAAFVANWEDKPTNLQRIAEALAIDVGALVFADDNPAERALVRQTLPTVAVPELPADPAEYARCLADAGYFESVAFTADDAKRARQYAANVQRAEAERRAPDMETFLKGLGMELVVGAFDRANLPRIAQLVNKTNQFNLTTRRYTESQLALFIGRRDSVALWFRLKDRYGDNGLISVVIATPLDNREGAMVIDTWLMSCRVLGRRVEEAALAALAADARKRGAGLLIGDYIRTPKNGLVRDHYRKLGFTDAGAGGGPESSRWLLDLAAYRPPAPAMTVTRVEDD